MITVEPALLDQVRGAYRAGAGRIPGVLIPAAVHPSSAAGLRARLAPALAPFYLADHGRYAVSESFADAVVFDELRELGEDVAGEPLAVGPARWTLLRHGDYALLKDDARTRAVPGRYLEATVDISEHTTGEAEVVYTDGREPLFVVPQIALSVALVERAVGAHRYERYLTHRVGGAEIYRLRLALVAR